MVVAVLCALLGNDKKYHEMKPDALRSVYVRALLNSACSSLDLPKELEGKGVPKLE